MDNMFGRFFVREVRQQYVQRQQVVDRIGQFFNELMVNENLTAQKLAELILCSDSPAVAQLKLIVELQVRQVIENQVKEFTEQELELALLTKDECWLSDKRYTLLRNLAGLQKHLPPCSLIAKTRESVNLRVYGELGMYFSMNPQGCYVNVGMCLSLMFKVNYIYFPLPWPNQTIIKFSFDGRMNNGEEVLVGLIPICNKLEQSGLNVYPLAIIKGKESDVIEDVRFMFSMVLPYEGHCWRLPNSVLWTRITFIVCLDFKSCWLATGLSYNKRGKKNEHTQFCPKCDKRSRAVNVWRRCKKRDNLPGLGIDSDNYIYCSLHAGMRVTEKLIALVGESLPTTANREAYKDELKAFGVKIREKKKDNRFLKAYLCGSWLDAFVLSKMDGLQLAVGLYTLLVHYQGNRFNMAKILFCWQYIFRIITLTRDINEQEITDLDSHCKTFFDLFKRQFPGQHTPYTHMITHHSVEILRKWKSIGRFSQQGFEYANRNDKQIFRHGTNKGGGRSRKLPVIQMMEVSYRRKLLAHDYSHTMAINRSLYRTSTRSKADEQAPISKWTDQQINDYLFIVYLNVVMVRGWSIDLNQFINNAPNNNDVEEDNEESEEEEEEEDE